MEFPVIIIDSTTNSVKDSEEDETEYLSPSTKDDYNFLVLNSLQIHRKPNDDGDSGIHGSSEVIGPSPVPSHKLLIEDALMDNSLINSKKIKLSLSASSLLERKRSFTKSYEKPMKNRNYSMDTGRHGSILKQQYSPYKLMIVDENGQPCYVQQINRDSIKSMISRPSSIPLDKIIRSSSKQEKGEQFVNSLCQIQLLLIIMKILLGSSITVFGIYIKKLSSSLEMIDCGFWASSVLLVSGLISIYFASENFYFLNPKIHNFYTILAIIVSGISSIMCMVASIYSGIHGNWISYHASQCDFSAEQMVEIKPPNCCLNYQLGEIIHWFPNLSTIKNTLQNQTNGSSCGCFYNDENLHRLYIGLNCKYLFSSLKDYFVLICSLMGVGSGCELWFVVYLFKYLCKSLSSREAETKRLRSRVTSMIEHSTVDFDIYNKHLPSPLIPAVALKNLKNS